MQNNTLQRTRYYVGPGYEKDIVNGGANRDIHYIESPAGLIAIVVRENGADTYHYVYTDHLGSILTLTNSAGTIEAEQNFDAWGRRRHPTTWSYIAVPTRPEWLYRGYTGHEMLDPFVLINMNGRIYDPVVGRVLSPDNYVIGAFSTQGFNRYSYALNNPLKYSDPDGNTPILGAILGGLGYALSVAFSDGGFRNWDWGQFAMSAALGAITAGFADGIGSAASELAKSGVSRTLVSAYQLGAHGVVGGFSSLAQGGNFGRGFLTSAVGSAVGSVTGRWGAVQIGSSAVLGGAVDAWSGGNFWRGAAQAGIVAAFNHFAHPLFQDPPAKRRAALKRSIEADGRLTWDESVRWYHEGQGGDLSLDPRKTGVGGTNAQQMFADKYGRYGVQLVWNNDNPQGRSLGNLLLQFEGNRVSILRDRFDFEQHEWWKVGRNFGAWLGGQVTGRGIPYNIYFNKGVSTMPVKQFKWPLPTSYYGF